MARFCCMAPIRIHLLGGFLLEHDGRNIPPIPSAAGRSLFAYLVTNRDRRHTRDLVAGTFWPDLPEQGARRRLSQTWWQIQTSLQDVKIGQPFIEATLFDVAFVATDYWLDIAEFDRHIAARPNSRWPEIRRNRYRSSRRSTSTGVNSWPASMTTGPTSNGSGCVRNIWSAWSGSSRSTRVRADYETAQYFARRLCLHDPLRESAHREVMRLSFLLGHSNEALRQYERCAEILSEELGRRPSSETEDLRIHIAQMREKGESPVCSHHQRPPPQRRPTDSAGGPDGGEEQHPAPHGGHPARPRRCDPDRGRIGHRKIPTGRGVGRRCPVARAEPPSGDLFGSRTAAPAAGHAARPGEWRDPAPVRSTSGRPASDHPHGSGGAGPSYQGMALRSRGPSPVSRHRQRPGPPSPHDSIRPLRPCRSEPHRAFHR